VNSGDESVPEVLREAEETPKDVNIILSEVCDRYLKEIDAILAMWEKYLGDKIDRSDLFKWSNNKIRQE
jgi:hypothetical protein